MLTLPEWKFFYKELNGDSWLSWDREIITALFGAGIKVLVVSYYYTVLGYVERDSEAMTSVAAEL